MKILFVHNYYTQFLKYFLSKNKGKFDHINYELHKKFLFDELFGISNFYSQGVIANGHNAIDVVANDWILQGKWVKEHGLKITTFPPIFLQSRIGQKLFLISWMEKILEEQIHEYRPDIIYFFDIESFSIKFLSKLKNKGYLIVAQKASPILSISQFKITNIVFSSFPHYKSLFKKYGIHCEFLRLAFGEIVLKQFPKQKKIYDCTFVGGLSKNHKKGTELIIAISEKKHIDLFGYGKNELSKLSQAYKNHHGEVWGKDMYQVFLQSNMTINRHIDIARNYANNMRLFEATGCGTMLLTDKKKNLGEFFIDGKEIVSYTNPDDLCDRIGYYSNHSKERVIIAKAGQKRTLKDYTYKKRMKELIQILMNKG